MTIVVGPALVTQGAGGILKFPEGYWLMFSPRGTDPPFPPPFKGIDCEVGMKAERLFHANDSQLSDVELALAFFKRAEMEVQPIPDAASFSQRHEWLTTNSRRSKLVNQIARMHARSFVSSAEMTLKLLKQLKKVAKGYELEDVIKQEEERLAQEIPHLEDLRDSIQHAEERIQGLAYKVPIVPDPLDTAEYQGPQIHVGTLHRDVLRYTANGGAQAEVSISDATLTSLIRCMQRVLNNAPWYAPKFGAAGPSGHPGLMRFKAVE